MNQKLVQRASWQELEPHLRPFMPQNWEAKDEEWKRVAITATQKGKSLKEMADSLAFVWERPAAFDEKAYALCFECHEAAAFTDEETDSTTAFRNGQRNLHYLHVNRAVKGRTCRACHDPHASKNEKHIVESVPFGKWRIPIKFESTSTGGSCQPGCHRPERYDREQPPPTSAAQ